ncbi:hypothetical protein [Rubrivirga sp.]|uniref:hypothetical protein n=1 Tax=Rubrivirga sp. TaxID=1885344 RepID=UPI003C72AC66
MFLHLLFAPAITAVAALLSSVLAALVTSALEAWRRRQRAEAREDEIALLAATVQRWRLTPAA